MVKGDLRLKHKPGLGLGHEIYNKFGFHHQHPPPPVTFFLTLKGSSQVRWTSRWTTSRTSGGTRGGQNVSMSQEWSRVVSAGVHDTSR